MNSRYVFVAMLLILLLGALIVLGTRLHSTGTPDIPLAPQEQNPSGPLP